MRSTSGLVETAARRTPVSYAGWLWAKCRTGSKSLFRKRHSDQHLFRQDQKDGGKAPGDAVLKWLKLSAEENKCVGTKRLPLVCC